MGLFGNKKQKPSVFVRDLFDSETLSTLRSTLLSKKDSYDKKYMQWIDALLKYTEDSNAELDKTAQGQVIFASGMLTKLEPALEPILSAAIKKYKSIK